MALGENRSVTSVTCKKYFTITGREKAKMKTGQPTSQVPSYARPQLRQFVRDTLNILVATAAQANDNILALVHGPGEFDRAVYSMGRLERGDDPFELRQETEPHKGFLVCGSDELGPFGVLPGRQLWADTWVVEPGRHLYSQ